VFHDENKNGLLDDGEPGIADVAVSNGIEVVQTGANGHYKLPVRDRTILFVCKPAGWTLPTDGSYLPQFYYIHDPDGSNEERLNYPGTDKTGPLPGSINFPMYPHKESESFRAVFLADPQPENKQEVQYFGRDIMPEVAATDTAFAITLGDLVRDRLNLFRPMIELQSLAERPWYNVIGNHDLNEKALNDQQAEVTFNKYFGPSTYAFQYARVHFIILDNVFYSGYDDGRGQSRGRLNQSQLKFVADYLNTVPKNHRVVLSCHIPLTHTRGSKQLMNLLSDFPHTCSFSGHTHENAIYYLGPEDGYTRDTDSVHPHHNLGTVSGTGWGEPLDGGGIPEVVNHGGAPGGYAIVSFDGQDYSVRWKVARRSADYQMNIDLPNVIAAESLKDAEVMANVFNGSCRSQTRMRVEEQTQWQSMKRVSRKDPYYRDSYKSDLQRSKHLWVAPMPQDLPKGTHMLQVKTRDMFGQTYRTQRPFRVE
jgi:hypothetical protein